MVVSVYVGFWRRFAALLIDLVLMLPLYAALRTLGLGPYVADAVNLVLLCVAYCLFLSSRWQATPGMRVMRVLAVDDALKPLPRGRVALWCAVSVGAVLLVFAPVLSVRPTAEMDAINHKVLEAKLAGKDPVSAFDGYSSQQVADYAHKSEQLRKRAPLSVLLMLLWVGTVVAGKEKAGLHNWLVRVRFVRGKVV